MNDSIIYNAKKLNSSEWGLVLNKFSDANIYQTEEFSKFSFGGENIEQFVVESKNRIIGAALVRIKLIPRLNKGVAYIRWAPMINLNNSQTNENSFEIILGLLYREYVVKRKLVLRIMSNLVEEDHSDLVNNFTKVGYKNYSKKNQTIIIDLNLDEDKLRANLRKKWRYSLKQAENKNFTLQVGTSDEYFDIFLNVYHQTHSRKNFKESVDVDSFKEINDSLPDNLKMHIFICSRNNEPLSAMVTSGIGNSAIYLLGGTTEKGLKLSSSYFLQWEVIKWMKSNGKHTYDLGGIDKENNPGVYTFKSGMGGQEVTYIGGFEAYLNKTSKSIVLLKELHSRIFS